MAQLTGQRGGGVAPGAAGEGGAKLPRQNILRLTGTKMTMTAFDE